VISPKAFGQEGRGYALIKQAFETNGIKFAYPTVQVAGGDTPPPWPSLLRPSRCSLSLLWWTNSGSLGSSG
jgi:hypothetical protein